jgi:hypothetical protein
MPRNLIERMTQAVRDALIFGTGTVHLEPEQQLEEPSQHLPIPILYGQQDAPQPLENYIVSDQQYTIPTTGIYNITTHVNNTEFTTGPIPIDAGYTYTITNVNDPIPVPTMFVPRDTVPTGYNFNPQGYFNAIPFETYRFIHQPYHTLTPDRYCDDNFVYEVPEGRIVSYRNYAILTETPTDLYNHGPRGTHITPDDSQFLRSFNKPKRKSNLPDWF